MQRLHHDDAVVDELWLDYDLGRHDDLRPVLELLLNWYDAGRPLVVRRVHVHTSSVEGAHLIAQVCRRIGYAVEREYGVAKLFTW